MELTAEPGLSFLIYTAEPGFEALKEFVGWNDLTGCLDKDIASCGMLAIGILPVASVSYPYGQGGASGHCPSPQSG